MGQKTVQIIFWENLTRETLPMIHFEIIDSQSQVTTDRSNLTRIKSTY